VVVPNYRDRPDQKKKTKGQRLADPFFFGVQVVVPNYRNRPDQKKKTKGQRLADPFFCVQVLSRFIGIILICTSIVFVPIQIRIALTLVIRSRLSNSCLNGFCFASILLLSAFLLPTL